MKNLTVKREENTFKIYLDNQVYSEIIFENTADAELRLENHIYRTDSDVNKDIVLSEDEKPLFTFKFDKLWGGAEIINSENNSELQIKGRWFKVGTRLIDEDDNDLVVVVNSDNGFDVTVNDNDVDPLMIISTIYYHIYASRGKLFTLLSNQ